MSCVVGPSPEVAKKGCGTKKVVEVIDFLERKFWVPTFVVLNKSIKLINLNAKQHRSILFLLKLQQADT